MLRRAVQSFIRISTLSLFLILLITRGEPAVLVVNVTMPQDIEKETPSQSDGDNNPAPTLTSSSSIAIAEAQHHHVQDDTVNSIPDQEEVEVYEVIATGYYAGVESTGKAPGHPEYGITYSGVKARRGVVSTIAADLNVFPIGTILYIPDYGYGVVADIGGAVKGNVIDLYFQSKEDVYREWGKRTVKVVVIEQGNGQLDEKKLQQLETLFKGRVPPPSAL